MRMVKISQYDFSSERAHKKDCDMIFNFLLMILYDSNILSSNLALEMIDTDENEKE